MCRRSDSCPRFIPFSPQIPSSAESFSLPPHRFFPAAPCWRAVEVTRVRALLLSRRKYRLRRKLFLCPRAVFPRRILLARRCSDWCPRFAPFSAVNFAFGGKFFSAAASFCFRRACHPRYAVSAATCGAVAPCNLPRRATRGGEDYFSENFVLSEKSGKQGPFARRKSVKRRNREQCFGGNFLTEMRCGGVFDRFFARRAKKRGGYFRIRLTGQGVSVTIEGEARKAPFG